MEFVFRLSRSASIRLMTLLGRSSGSGASMVWPLALRWTSFLSAVSYSSLNFSGSNVAALVSRMCEANATSAGRHRRRRYRADPVKRRQFRVEFASHANHAMVDALSQRRSPSRNDDEVCDASQNRSSHSGFASSKQFQFDVFCSDWRLAFRRAKGSCWFT